VFEVTSKAGLTVDTPYTISAKTIADGTEHTISGSVAVTDPGKKSGGGGGCDAGFAGLALLLAAPLFLRKRS
jgi:Synergist-CTERM protein sorting domain-containing protein